MNKAKGNEYQTSFVEQGTRKVKPSKWCLRDGKEGFILRRRWVKSKKSPLVTSVWDLTAVETKAGLQGSMTMNSEQPEKILPGQPLAWPVLLYVHMMDSSVCIMGIKFDAVTSSKV